MRGVVKLCDFGISDSASAGGGYGGGDGDGAGRTPLEVEDKGTPEYMAPECFTRLLGLAKSMPALNATVAVGDGGGDALAVLRYVRVLACARSHATRTRT